MVDKNQQPVDTIKLMTHIVAGFPDYGTSLNLAQTMAQAGVSFLEVQIPFSDPIADGPVIVRAGDAARSRGMSVDSCFRLTKELAASTAIPIFIMTYCAIPFCRGWENFVRNCKDSGIRGLIVPDLPYDEPEALLFLDVCAKAGIWYIPVVSPGISPVRLEKLCNSAGGMVYVTLRTGITGTQRKIGDEGIDLVRRVKEMAKVPVACGFGISSPDQVRSLAGIADIAVIGSRTVELVEKEGVAGVERFIKECLRGN